ncbi:uncharacterized protein E1O_26010 [Burkholderiales bacterium GJ-E10]|nr:uncharacterized protein E1O_26010 [Burkholderiales bacterium GJ-E10]
MHDMTSSGIARLAMAAMIAAGPAHGAGIAASDPAAALAAIDQVRVGSGAGQLRIRLTSAKWGAEDMRVCIRRDAAEIDVLSGRYASERVLMQGENVWVRMPHSSRTIAITPIERILGQASYGDLARSHWVGSYTPSWNPVAAEKGRPQGRPQGDRGAVDRDAMVLDLRATTTHRAYQRIAVTVDRKTGWPIAARFYLGSGKLFKLARYGRPTTLGGRLLIVQTWFVDPADPGTATLLEIRRVDPGPCPAGRFTVDGFAE